MNTAIIHSYSTLRGEIEIEIIMVKVMKKRVTNIDVTTRGKIQIDIFMVATVTKLVMKIIFTTRGEVKVEVFMVTVMTRHAIKNMTMIMVIVTMKHKMIVVSRDHERRGRDIHGCCHNETCDEDLCYLERRDRD